MLNLKVPGSASLCISEIQLVFADFESLLNPCNAAWVAPVGGSKFCPMQRTRSTF